MSLGMLLVFFRVEELRPFQNRPKYYSTVARPISSMLRGNRIINFPWLPSSQKPLLHCNYVIIYAICWEIGTFEHKLFHRMFAGLCVLGADDFQANNVTRPRMGPLTNNMI